MTKPSLALLLLTSALAGAGALGCTDDSTDTGDTGDDGGGGGGGDDGGGGGGGEAPPFTDGVSMLSGGAEAGYADGARGVARFANPVNVAVAPDGKVYVADFDNGKIRVVDARTGETGTVVSQMGFQRPFGLAFAPDGTLYVSTDRDPSGAHGPMMGTIWRVDIGAGSATAIATRIGRPRGIAVLPDGRIAATDYMHHVVQIVNPATGAVTPLAGTWDQPGMVDGTGAAARFSSPYGVAVWDGRLVVADNGNHRLRAVTLDGVVTTMAGAGQAGFADGAMTSARFNKPQGVAVDASGALYVSDLENYRVRRISGSSVETVAGDGTSGYADNDDRLAARFYGLEGIAVTPDGARAFVADGSRGEDLPYHRVRVIELR